MLNGLPVIGWAVSFVVAVSMSVPFWLGWSVYGIGQRYFGFLPTQWQSIPFWDCVWLAICITIVKAVIVPKLASVSQSNEKNG